MVLTPGPAVVAAALAFAAGLLLSSCGGTSTTSTTVSASAVDGATLPAHVHNLAYKGDTLLFGTHE